MTTNPAPITNPVVDESGRPTLPWVLFFNQTFEGDAGEEWTPNFVGLTGSTTSVTGRFYRLSQYLTYFTINITPSGATTSTAGSTYIDNFPLNITGDGVNAAVSSNIGGTLGMNTSATNRIYTPAWSGVSAPLTVVGIVEAG